jgi:hypothetical protein
MRVSGWTSSFIAGAIVAAFIVPVVGLAPANAQQSQTAQQSQIPSASAFLANPEQLLQQNPNGGSQLSNDVQALALADPSTFKALLGLTQKANDLQKGAIGAGLAQATKIEVLTNQALAEDWQQQIAAITDPTFQVAATNAFGDVQLGAVGGSALGAAGSGLGGPGNGPGGLPTGTPENIQSTPFATQPFALTSSISGAAVVNTSNSP